jgi:hypothetical protein
MAQQLHLTEVPAPTVWRLDERTKETGRRGIATARAALAAHRPEAHGHRTAA